MASRLHLVMPNHCPVAVPPWSFSCLNWHWKFKSWHSVRLTKGFCKGNELPLHMNPARMPQLSCTYLDFAVVSTSHGTNSFSCFGDARVQAKSCEMLWDAVRCCRGTSVGWPLRLARLGDCLGSLHASTQRHSFTCAWAKRSTGYWWEVP